MLFKPNFDRRFTTPLSTKMTLANDDVLKTAVLVGSLTLLRPADFCHIFFRLRTFVTIFTPDSFSFVPGGGGVDSVFSHWRMGIGRVRGHSLCFVKIILVKVISSHQVKKVKQNVL